MPFLNCVKIDNITLDIILYKKVMLITVYKNV